MTGKAALKRLVALAARGSATGRRVILCYHSIHPDAGYRDLTPREFEEHLDYLTARAQVLPLVDLLAQPSGGSGPPRVALTFDDAFADNASVVAPILRERGLAAAFFVTTGFVDGDPTVRRHMGSLHGLAPSDVDAMSWADVERVAADGHLIGSHSHTHRNLSKLPAAEQLRELEHSGDLLERRLGIRPRFFAYPYGKPGAHYTASTARLTVEAGYEHALAVTFEDVPPQGDPRTVPRFTVAGVSVEDLDRRVSGALDAVGLWQRRAPRTLRRLVSPRDFAYE